MLTTDQLLIFLRRIMPPLQVQALQGEHTLLLPDTRPLYLPLHTLPPILNHPLPVPHFPIGLTSPSPIPCHGIYSLAFPYSTCLLPAFEDGTDTWFRNVGILHIDAREIPKRTYTIFKSRRKLEIYSECLFYTWFCSLPI